MVGRDPMKSTVRSLRRGWIALAFLCVPLAMTEACGSSSAGTVDITPGTAKDGSVKGGDGAQASGDSALAALDGTQQRPSCPAAPYGKLFTNLIYDVGKHIIEAGAPASGAFNVPTQADRDTFAAQVLAALKFDGTDPCPLPPSYIVMSLVDGSDEVRVVGEFDKYGTSKPTLFWGAYAARRQGPGTRPLVIEAPHPVADPDTDNESARMFTATRAEWYLIAGSHRCANTTVSACDGTTGVCTNGTQSPYREADTAHSTKTPFYGVHVALSAATTAPFLQLHGNGETCPAALVSDCSGTFPAAGLAAQLATALEKNAVTVGRCGAGYPTAACSLCGTENVEARATAGAVDSCTMQGTGYGRFIHIEQQLSISDATGDLPVIAAVNATFTPR
jgi:hypothetical protein